MRAKKWSLIISMLVMTTIIKPMNTQAIEIFHKYTSEWIEVDGIEGGKVKFDAKTGTIIEAEKSITQATIPEQINGVAVKAIGVMAFAENDNLKLVQLPSSIKTIKPAGFWRCHSLEIVLFAEGLEKIGLDGFGECTSLCEIILPSTLTIFDNAFRNCTSLRKVVLPKYLKVIPTGAFYNCTSLYDIKIPLSVELIETNSFYGCKGFEHLVIPGNVKTIESHAFQMISAKTVTLENGIETIEPHAFAGWIGNTDVLEKVIIQANKIDIDKKAFYGQVNTVLEGHIGSPAEKYANKNDMKFSVLGAICIEAAEVYDLQDSYDGIGKEVKPAISVIIDNEILEEGTDYVVEYKDNIERGTATLIIRGLNKYQGEIKKTFFINKLDYELYDMPSKNEIKQVYERIKLLDTQVVYEENSSSIIGQVNDTSLQNGLEVFNYIRFIAGLEPVQLNQEFTELAQIVTFINANNGTLSRFPSKSQNISKGLYDLGVKAAKASNLAKNGTIVRSLWAFMHDSNSNNICEVGHRRWLLNPSMGETGFGYSDQIFALYSIDNSKFSENAKSTIWPAENMPIEHFSNLQAWSFSNPRNFTDDMSVKLSKNDGEQTWEFHSNDNNSDGFFNISKVSYGQPGALIFRPDDVVYEDGDIFKIQILKDNELVFDYRVNFFSLKKDDEPTIELEENPEFEEITVLEEVKV
ncbi:hypothetical protein AN639_02720 [Epulopiscium sp. SCG-B05WGA-EpuloA1]|uniref:Uncharacterized protein n=1 Tax=Candidatus Epulonipiscium fishelsonii TaxID=77094 RepID=A0ACC8XEK3_9FIRM|nr:hypothetical protein AN396_03575 [Epulopiscium sp. SCG-B11WGA-EpuloA1]ONI41938.1 hypothetical protein AN639_02720 [Epulopiscium sp. SCG-B05WGA-EpuloA1]